MPGTRLYPAHHGYGLDHPAFRNLLKSASRRGLVVRIAIRMEDERVHHPSLVAPVVDAAPLVESLAKFREARVRLLNADTVFRGGHPNYRGQVPVDRLLFGSHAPFFPCESALLKLFESPLDRPWLEAIMRVDARQWLG